MAQATLLEPDKFQVTGFPCAHRYRLKKRVYVTPTTQDTREYLPIPAGKLSVD